MFGRVFWAIAAVYLACTALRLARFNVETASAHVDDHMFFRGLPAPGAAGCIASLILLHQKWLAGAEYHWAARVTGLGMAGIMLLCALAMVSRYTYVHVINRYIRGHASFGYVVKLAIILAFGLFNPVEALAIGFTAYALSAPSQYVWRSWSRMGRRAVKV
jgi:CDP-diacylglycerol--serine O-phosphatidyltransferase